MESVHLLRWLNKLARDRGGNALVVCAATLPLVIGAAAIGVDTIQVSLARRQLQRTADSAALAGAYAKHNNQNVNTAVTHDLGLNDDVTLSVPAVVENAPTAGPQAGNTRAVRVVLTAERAVPFISFFTGDTMTVTAEATAMSVFEGQYCMVSLEDTNVTGIAIGGNATVNLGCGMISNSPSASAVTATGSSVVNADPVAAVGVVPASSNFASGTTLMSYSPRQEDPFADLPTPTVPTNCPNTQLRVQPNDPALNIASLPATAINGYMGGNVWCWSGIDIKGTVTFPPGATIYVNGGDLGFGSQANVTGLGVTFILTHENAATNPNQIAGVDIQGGAQMNLTAPDTGTYAGVLIYQDRRAPFDTSHINGNSSTFFRGAFYFPSQELIFNGTSGMQTECVQMVGRRLGFSGNSTINNSCPANGGSQAFDAIYIRLVG